MIEFLNINQKPEQINDFAIWFHQKWEIPLQEYQKSMQECIKKQNTIPQWYFVMHCNEIIAGVGVIENDFHERKDLTPNVCALYVEEEHRNKGIAGQLLDMVCQDMHNKGIDTLYLITDHNSFYEKYGWNFYDMVQCDDGEVLRMYIKQSK